MDRPCVECDRRRVQRITTGRCRACAEWRWRQAHPEEFKARQQRAYAKHAAKMEWYPRGRPLEERLLRRLVCNIQTRCWEWQLKKTEKGYARMVVDFNGKKWRTKYVHQVAYELYKGTIPDGLQIDHLCRNRSCANPDHLEVVTGYENFLRGNRGSAGGVVMKAKTHCKFGHPYDEQNTYVHRSHRYCKTCHNERRRNGFIVPMIRPVKPEEEEEA